MGIPTVVDRLVQQAILQVLEGILEPTFSESSYGFRRGRNAHQAVRQAAEYVAEGRVVVVDIDLEKFFDRVNHDVLMSRLARHVADKRLLRIVRRFLEAGMMRDGVKIARHEGTPQGGPLSPMLARKDGSFSNLHTNSASSVVSSRSRRRGVSLSTPQIIAECSSRWGATGQSFTGSQPGAGPGRPPPRSSSFARSVRIR